MRMALDMCCALDMPRGHEGIYIISKRSYIEWAPPIYRICVSKYIDTPDRADGSLSIGGAFGLSQFKSKYMGTQSLTKVPRSPYMVLPKVLKPRRR